MLRELYTKVKTPYSKSYYPIIEGEPDLTQECKTATEAIELASKHIKDRAKMIEDALSENMKIEKMNTGEIEEDVVDSYFRGAPEKS